MTKEFSLETCIMCITSQSSRLCSEILDQKLRRQNISQNVFLSLYYIEHAEKCINQKQLAARLGITGASMTKIIQKMTEQDLVEIIVCQQDRRQKNLGLTTSGKKLLKKIIPTVKQFQEQMTAGISQADLDAAARVMDQLCQNAKQAANQEKQF